MTAFWLVATPVLVSLGSEFVSWVSAKLNKTPLQGNGAFVATMIVSVIGGIGYLAYNQIPANYLVELTKYSTIFLGGATLFFNLFSKNIPTLQFGSQTTTQQG